MAKRPKRHRSGECTLRWRGPIAVACFTDPRSGKPKRVKLEGKFRKDSKEARDALDRFAEKLRATVAEAKSYSVGELWIMWLADRAEDGFSNELYAHQWKALAPVFQNRSPGLLKKKDFRQYARDRFALGRSSWTVHNELVRMRSLFKWALENDHIPKRPKVWVPKAGGNRDRVLSRPEAIALVAAAREGDPHIYVFVLLAFATGARHMAILDLTWERVNWDRGLITFDENLPPDPMNKSWRKGRAIVPMNKTVRAALELAYMGRQTDHVVEHGRKRLVTVKNGFKNAVERAGIDESIGKVTPHTIRHTVLTWLDEAAVETRRRAQLAGHKDERTTKLYTHSKPEVLTDAVSILDDAFDGLRQIDVQPLVENGVSSAQETSAMDELGDEDDDDDEDDEA